jgi:hypothetical protein
MSIGGRIAKSRFPFRQSMPLVGTACLRFSTTERWRAVVGS